MFGWFGNIKRWAIEAGAALLAVLLALTYGRYKGEKAGVNEAAAKSAEKTERAVEARAKVDNAVQRDPEGAAAKELQKDWSRP